MTSTAAHSRRVLAETYCALARQIGASEIDYARGFVFARGRFPHPICNFGILLDDASPEDLEILEGKASESSQFNLYNFSPSGSSTLEPKGTWNRIYRLHQLLIERRDRDPDILLNAAVDRPARRAVASFMADQFFTTQAPHIRNTIARATADAEGLELYWTPAEDDLNRIVGAVMLHHNGEATGLYNLCVSPEYRSAGIGSDIVRRVAAERSAAGLKTILQCDGALLDWYIGLGFVEIGTWQVYNLAKNDQPVIMS